MEYNIKQQTTANDHLVPKTEFRIMVTIYVVKDHSQLSGKCDIQNNEYDC